MFELIKKVFIRLLSGLVNGSNHTKRASLSNQKWKIQPTLINLHPLIFDKVNEYFEEVNENKYLTLVPTNESKEKIKNMESYEPIQQQDAVATS